MEGDEARRRAFKETVLMLSRRIDLLLALPIEKLEHQAREEHARAIAAATPNLAPFVTTLAPTPSP